jgi:hypothetical protein
MESAPRKPLEGSEFKIKLDKAIVDFSASHQYLNNQKEAEWQCMEVSQEFIKYLYDLGVIEPGMISSGLVGQFHTRVNNIPHTVVKIGNTLIDWTRRQFQPNSPFPYVYKI